MLSLLLLLNQDMDMVMDMAMDIMVMDMVMDMAMDMDMVIMDITARDLLSQDVDIMAMDMDMDMVMVMVMAMVMDTTAKQICCSFSEFSTNEVGPYRSSQKTHNFHLKENKY